MYDEAVEIYLDQCLGSVQEMLPALGLRALLVPINDSLIRYTILIVQNLWPRVQLRMNLLKVAHIATHLENLWECFDDARVFIRVHLHGVDEGNLGLGAIAEGFKNVCEILTNRSGSRAGGVGRKRDAL